MKNIVLFVNAIRPATFEALNRYAEQTGHRFIPVVIVDAAIAGSIAERNGQLAHQHRVQTIVADFNAPASIRQALAPYSDQIFAVTAQYENSIEELKKLIPYLPYLPTPLETTLDWATEKKLMRQQMEASDPRLVPGYLEVTDATPATIKAINDRLTYPVIVKPSGLEGSLLVTLVTNPANLTSVLRNTFSGVQTAYDKWIKRQKPRLLVEEFMDGQMYSVDAYVADDGTCRHTPPVKITTGRQAGFEDFFGYIQQVPADLAPADVQAANKAVAAACSALGLRSVTAHVELMKLQSGWKIVELGPRVGGFRHEIYSLGYGINHLVNDILNRGGLEPIIPTKLQAPTAFLNIYAPKEGTLNAIHGLTKVKKLPSVRSIIQLNQIGESLQFAKHNGDPIFKVVLSHPSRQQFDQDIQILTTELTFDVD